MRNTPTEINPVNKENSIPLKAEESKIASAIRQNAGLLVTGVLAIAGVSYKYNEGYNRVEESISRDWEFVNSVEEEERKALSRITNMVSTLDTAKSTYNQYHLIQYSSEDPSGSNDRIPVVEDTVCFNQNNPYLFDFIAQESLRFQENCQTDSLPQINSELRHNSFVRDSNGGIIIFDRFARYRLTETGSLEQLISYNEKFFISRVLSTNALELFIQTDQLLSELDSSLLEKENYDTNGVTTVALENYFRTELDRNITGLQQTVRRSGSRAVRENFLTPEMTSSIRNALLTFCEIFNINKFNMIADFQEYISNRQVNYTVSSPGTERAEIYSHNTSGPINIYGDTDEVLVFALVHEFFHAYLSNHFSLHSRNRHIHAYAEGMTELLARISLSENEPVDYDPYRQSTFLTTAAGFLRKIKENSLAQSQVPITLEQLFAGTSNIQTVTNAMHDGVLDYNEDLTQQTFLHPQTDTYVLPTYGRRVDSIGSLRRLMQARRLNWYRYRRSMQDELEFVFSDIKGNIPEENVNNVQNLQEHFRALWSNN